MNTEQWRQVERLYREVAGQPGAEQRRFLDEACGRDTELRRQVDSLLGYEDRVEGFLETNALAVVANDLAGAEGTGVDSRVGSETLLHALCMSELEQAASEPHLLVKAPEGHVQRVMLTKDRLCLGRESLNDIAVPEDDGLSRRHLVLDRKGEVWTATNVGRNGTLVNGTRIQGPVELHPGDQIVASCVQLTFCDT